MKSMPSFPFTTYTVSLAVFELICGVQNYLWGKKGTNSKVAQLRSSSDSEFIVNEHSHYAEVVTTALFLLSTFIETRMSSISRNFCTLRVTLGLD